MQNESLRRLLLVAAATLLAVLLADFYFKTYSLENLLMVSHPTTHCAAGPGMYAEDFAAPSHV